MLAPGDQLKDYEVVASLTEGGMATLVLARRKRPSEGSNLVALKVVHEHLSDDSGMIRLFLDEARVTARVKHTNVVHVEEVGIHRGSYFLVMEYVHGVSLASLLNRLAMERRRVSPKLAVYLAAQAAEALHAAHEATDGRGRSLHVVHRDVSPQNVLLSHLGHVKLIDFGIATSQTGTGVLGKLSYMAPEQITLTEVDRRTDVYSLGIVLWEALTGRALFRSQNYDDYRDPAIRTRIAPPSRYGNEVPPLLDEVVMRALAPHADDRWESAAAFRRAMLQAVPEAANLDPRQLSAVVHVFAGDELNRLRARLPDDITRELDHQRSPSQSSVDTAIANSLTVEQLDPGISMLPQTAALQLDPDTDLLPQTQDLQLDLDREPTRQVVEPIALRFHSHAPEEPPPETLWNKLRAQFAWSSVALAVSCLLLGVAIGRVTSRGGSVGQSRAGLAESNASSTTAAPGVVRSAAPVAGHAAPASLEPTPASKPRTAPAAEMKARAVVPRVAKTDRTSESKKSKAAARKRRAQTTKTRRE